MDYDNFIFYGSWRTLLEGFSEDIAKDILWSIMTLGTAGDIDTDNPMIEGIVLGAIAPNIKAAQNRYNAAVENGKKGGRPGKLTEEDQEKIRQMRLDGKTAQVIATELGYGLNTIKRSEGWRAGDPKTQNPTTQNPKPTQNLDIDIDIDNETDKEKELLEKVEPPSPERAHLAGEWAKRQRFSD